MRRALVVVPLLAGCAPRVPLELARGEAVQLPDSDFVGMLGIAPLFPPSVRPVVTIDQAHHNFHTASGRFRAFAQLLDRAGFQVREGTDPISQASLGHTRLLVVANALNARQLRSSSWTLPALGAFTRGEIRAVTEWIRGGGSLLLIADHMPFPGAISDLASALGVNWANGYALPPGPPDPATGDYLITFRRSDGGLTDNVISNGGSVVDRVDSVTTFTGSAFWIDPSLEPVELLRLPAGTRIKLPQRAWRFSDSTAEVPGAGVAQGAVFRLGKGRVAVFGEAAMFSAQLKGPAHVRMGMNNPIAAGNPRFILNLIRWLTQ